MAALEELHKNGRIDLEPLPEADQLLFANATYDVSTNSYDRAFPGLEDEIEPSGVGSFVVVFKSYPEQSWLDTLRSRGLAVLEPMPAMGYGGFAFVIMPATSLAMQMAALITRMLRSGMVDVLQEDYITATYAKGISNREITMKYALRNAILPVITVVGLQVGTFLGGAVVTEQIFGWPGIGTLTVQAIGLRDFPLVQSILLVISACFVLVNLLVDIIYTIVDPRMDFN